MSEFSQHVLWARVAYTPQLAQSALTALAMAPELKGPGLSAADAVQVATYFAMLRDVCASYDVRAGGPYGRVAIYDASGHPWKEVEFVGPQSELASKMSGKGQVGAFVVGDAPFLNPHVPLASWQPVDGWGKKLALSIDGLLKEIAAAEQGPNVPIGMTDILPVVFPAALAPLAVIVTGAAISIIASIAIWRYLDPDLRRDIMLVRQAAENYAQRLSIYKDTGQMPPPSENERNALPTVEKLASSRSTTDWLWGAGIAAGLTAGALVTVAIARQ